MTNADPVRGSRKKPGSRTLKTPRASSPRMRSRALLVVLVALTTVAGCFGGDAEESPPSTTTPEATPTVSTPEATPTAEPTPAPTPPPPPAPKVVYNKTFDFAQGDATGQSPNTESSEAVPEEYGNVTVNLTIARSGSAPTPIPVSGTVNSPMVRIVDPAGNEVIAEGAEGTAVNATFPTTAGAWTIHYEGAGTLTATVVLTATR